MLNYVENAVCGVLAAGAAQHIPLPVPVNRWNHIQDVAEVQVWSTATFTYSYDNVNYASWPADIPLVIPVTHKFVHSGPAETADGLIGKIWFTNAADLNFDIRGGSKNTV